MGTGEEELISFSPSWLLESTGSDLQPASIKHPGFYRPVFSMQTSNSLHLFFFLIGSHFLIFLIKVYLINSVSGIQQSDSTVHLYIYMYIFSQVQSLIHVDSL